ncbi:MAG: peptidase [Minwuia sp.]|uniref:peptidase n=1 Tax=Minwuia sp. TaxID=2493630 RepID=UPI003A88C370
MTYCVGTLTAEGLVMLADTRTNAGIDHISTFRKLKIWTKDGERTVALMSAGNLAVTQAVVGLLNERMDDPEWDQTQTILGAPSMFMVARVVGEAIRDVRRVDGPSLDQGAGGFHASFLLGGQIAGRNLRLYQIYAEGNFIEATQDTPFFQIGETKYGKPILDRVMNFDVPVREAVKVCLISMDSTLRSNMSVGLPLDLMVYRRNCAGEFVERRITEDNADYARIRDGWGDALRKAYRNIADVDLPV